MILTLTVMEIKTFQDFSHINALGIKEALAIRRIFSLVDRLQKLNFQIVLMILKFICLGSIICIVSIK